MFLPVSVWESSAKGQIAHLGPHCWMQEECNRLALLQCFLHNKSIYVGCIVFVFLNIKKHLAYRLSQWRSLRMREHVMKKHFRRCIEWQGRQLPVQGAIIGSFQRNDLSFQLLGQTWPAGIDGWEGKMTEPLPALSCAAREKSLLCFTFRFESIFERMRIWGRQFLVCGGPDGRHVQQGKERSYWPSSSLRREKRAAERARPLIPSPHSFSALGMGPVRIYFIYF